MTIENDQTDIFYLGFNKNTGSFVEVIPPKGKEVTLNPKTVYEHSLGRLRKEEASLLKEIDAFNENCKEFALPPLTITFVDTPGGSICSGSVGGIPFRFKC